MSDSTCSCSHEPGCHHYVSQAEVDDLVRRLRELVKLHGGDSPKLKTCRTLYGFLQTRFEHATFGLLLVEVDRLEQEE